MTKGFTKDHKFHPMTDYKKVTRKSRDPKVKTDGVRFKKLLGKPKQASSFMIGAKGLEPIFTNIIPLEVGGRYWLGASSDPDHIIITKIEDDRFFYRSYPYDKDIGIERDVGEDLIKTGLTNRLKVIENSTVNHLFEKDIKNIRLLLESDDDGVDKIDFRDLQPVAIEVDLKKLAESQEEDSKLWFHAESFGGVGGTLMTDKAGKRIEGDDRIKGYSISTTREQLKKIKNDPLYKNFRITEDKYKGK